MHLTEDRAADAEGFLRTALRMSLARQQADVGDDKRRQVIQRDLDRKPQAKSTAEQFVTMIERGQPSTYHQRDTDGTTQVYRCRDNGDDLMQVLPLLAQQLG